MNGVIKSMLALSFVSFFTYEIVQSHEESQKTSKQLQAVPAQHEPQGLIYYAYSVLQTQGMVYIKSDGCPFLY